MVITPKSRFCATFPLTAEPGQVIGIFGMTGAGKSTLLGLIPRFYDPQRGRILADGMDLRDLDLDAYRRQIGIVYQESFLFSNTVSANIAFGSPHATQRANRAAARIACAHDFITALPRGYATVLGESGVDLSGGQRQRLALARALLPAAAHPDPGRPDRLGGCQDRTRNRHRLARGHGGPDGVCRFQPPEPAAPRRCHPGAGKRAADADAAPTINWPIVPAFITKRPCCN